MTQKAKLRYAGFIIQYFKERYPLGKDLSTFTIFAIAANTITIIHNKNTINFKNKNQLHKLENVFDDATLTRIIDRLNLYVTNSIMYITDKKMIDAFINNN